MTTITAPKKESTDIAIGYASGHVRLINFQTNQRTKSLNPDVMNNLVEWIDFNCNDDYVVVLYDNGHVRTFNVNTGMQSEKIKVDNAIGIIRYHNTKPHIMGMGCRTGSIHVWDSLKKRVIYKDSEAHNAPIRDVAWDLSNPDLFYFGGYDCCVKVVDIRKRFCGMTLKNQHPINCFNVSGCGNFVTTGNLAGEVHLYDTRNPKHVLHETDLSGGTGAKVQRITVVPGNREASVETESSGVNISDSQEETSSVNVTPNTEINNLIAAAKSNKTRVTIGENMSDSLLNMSHNRQNLASRRSSIGFGMKRLSADFGAQNLMRYLDLSTESIDSPTGPSPTTDSVKQQRRSLQNLSDNVILEQSEPISTTPKSSSRLDALSKVDELQETGSFYTPPTSIETNLIANKENIAFIPTDGHTSTPNISEPISKQVSSTVSDSQEGTPTIMPESNKISNNDMSKILAAINAVGESVSQLNFRMDKLEENMKEQVLKTQFCLQEEHYHRFWGMHRTLLYQAGLIKEKIQEVDDDLNVVGKYVSMACPLEREEEVVLPMNAALYSEINKNWEKQFEGKD